MRRPRLLDLFCGAGGAAMGYYNAGFQVVGVDIKPMPRYPFEFHQDDALRFIKEHGHEFNAIHASPPCQAYSKARVIRNREHPDLIAIVRELILPLGVPYVIENVVGAPLISPVTLCGSLFPPMRVYRHRIFESNVVIMPMSCRPHRHPQAKMGRPPRADQFVHVVGNYSGAANAESAMGIDWMTRDELREAIPPAYTEYVGGFLMKAIAGDRARSERTHE